MKKNCNSRRPGSSSMKKNKKTSADEVTNGKSKSSSRNRKNTTNTNNISSNQRHTKDQEPSVHDWVGQLAKAAVSAADGSNATFAGQSLTTKAERIEKRLNKKRKREEIKKRKREDADSKRGEHLRRYEKDKSEGRNSGSNDRGGLPSAKKTNTILKDELAQRIQAIATTLTHNKTQRPYDFTSKNKKSDKSNQKLYLKKKWDHAGIQPRSRDYGGIGLARPSLFLCTDDPSFCPKLVEEFSEHVPGFFGKQKTKVMKKQQSAGMLWRRLADSKKKQRSGDEEGGGNSHNNLRVNGKRLADMTPDERVEAMIKAGLV